MRCRVVVPMLLTLILGPGSARAQERVKPIVEWVGIVSDIDLQKREPASGIIANRTDFEALWLAWRGTEKPPTIDFDSYVVAVGTSDLVILRLIPERNPRTGELTVVKEIESPDARVKKGFSYGIAVIGRNGIASTSGSSLKTPAALTLQGHKSTVWQVAWSPDGKMLASASFDSTVRLWDPVNGRLLGELKHHTWLISVAIAPNGKLLAAGDIDGNVFLWDLAKREKIATLTGHKDKVRGLAFTADGKTLASTGWDAKVILWDVEKAEERKTIAIDRNAINSIAISPDGKTGAVASIGKSEMGDWNSISLWSVETGKIIGTLKPTGYFVAFSPDGKLLAGGPWIWDWAKSDNVLKLKVPESHKINGVAWSPDGKLIATAGEDHTVRLWDAATGEETAVFKGHKREVRSVAFSPDGKSLASASDDDTVWIWPVNRPASGAVQEAPLQDASPRTLNGHQSTVWSVAWSPDGKVVASASFDNSVRLWDPSSGRQLAELKHPDWMISVAISPNGKYLAAGDLNGKVYLWDLAKREKIATLAGHTDRVRGLAFTADSKTLASAAWDEKVILWDVEKAEKRKTIPINNAAINTLAISPDGKTGAVASIGKGDGIVISLWSVETGKVIDTLKPSGYFVAFSPDGKQLAGGPWIWNWARSKNVLKLNVPESHPVNGVSWSPDGTRIATAGEDNTVRLWDAATGEEVAVFKGHTKVVTSVAFSPDGKSVASTSLDETVRIWPVKESPKAPR